MSTNQARCRAQVRLLFHRDQIPFARLHSCKISLEDLVTPAPNFRSTGNSDLAGDFSPGRLVRCRKDRPPRSTLWHVGCFRSLSVRCVPSLSLVGTRKICRPASRLRGFNLAPDSFLFSDPFHRRLSNSKQRSGRLSASCPVCLLS
jgi:hypothetical protein